MRLVSITTHHASVPRVLDVLQISQSKAVVGRRPTRRRLFLYLHICTTALHM